MLGGPTRFNPDTHQLFFGGEAEIFQCLALAPKSVKLACVERIKDNAPTTKPGKVDLVLHFTDFCNYRDTTYRKQKSCGFRYHKPSPTPTLV